MFYLTKNIQSNIAFMKRWMRSSGESKNKHNGFKCTGQFSYNQLNHVWNTQTQCFLSLNNSSVENTEPVSLPNIAVTTKETPVIKSGK